MRARFGMAPIVLLLLVVSGCVSRDTGGIRQSYSRYLRVHPVKGQSRAYALERSVSAADTFGRGTIAIFGHPRENMRPHMLGALPAQSGVFVLWPDAGDPTRSPLPRARGVEIPAMGGPWRGVVVELHRGTRYPAVPFTPVPAQPGGRRRGPVATELLYCDTPNILACMSWAAAVQAGWVTCEDAHRSKLPASDCLRYVPRTQWRVGPLK